MGLDTAVPSGPWRYSDYAVRYTLRHSSVGDGEAHVCARRANGTLLVVMEEGGEGREGRDPPGRGRWRCAQ